MLLLRSIELRPQADPPKKFPYTLTCVKTLDRLDFLHEVNFPGNPGLRSWVDHRR
jgi:hypothetical protein